VELREALAGHEDLRILYVMAEQQVNEKTRRFVDEAGLRERVRFLRDPGSRTIERLGLLLQTPEPLEAGVPHPATYLLDREGRIRLVDVREDFHIWLDPSLIVQALAELPAS
jgi:peroxiredoxin